MPLHVAAKLQMCLFWAKNNMDVLLWDKHEGDGRILTPGQVRLAFLHCDL